MKKETGLNSHPVRVVEGAAPPRIPGIEVIAGSRRVVVPAGFDAEHLRAVLRVIEALPPGESALGASVRLHGPPLEPSEDRTETDEAALAAEEASPGLPLFGLTLSGDPREVAEAVQDPRTMRRYPP